MRPMLPVKVPDIHKLQVNLLNEVRGLQRCADLLLPQKVAGKAAQFALNSRHELSERFIVSAGPGAKELRGLGRGWLSHAFIEIILLRPGMIPGSEISGMFFCAPVAVLSPELRLLGCKSSAAHHARAASYRKGEVMKTIYRAAASACGTALLA